MPVIPCRPKWKSAISDRERFNNQMHYRPVDRCFNMEFGYWDENFREWPLFVENGVTNNEEADIFFNFDRIKMVRGTVWMNPPYSQPLVSKFCDKFIERKMIGAITQGCVILNNVTETKFLQKMLVCCTAICLIKGRVKFLDAEGNIVNSSPLQGQIILYFGPHRDKFAKVFNKFGVVFDAR